MNQFSNVIIDQSLKKVLRVQNRTKMNPLIFTNIESRRFTADEKTDFRHQRLFRHIAHGFSVEDIFNNACMVF